MRISTDPRNPVALFEITPYDRGMETADINDFLFVLQHGPQDLKQMLLNHNGIVSINVQGNDLFNRNTLLIMTFTDREAMMRYLKGEITNPAQVAIINTRLKEFFDERDKVQTTT